MSDGDFTADPEIVHKIEEHHQQTQTHRARITPLTGKIPLDQHVNKKISNIHDVFDAHSQFNAQSKKGFTDIFTAVQDASRKIHNINTPTHNDHTHSHKNHHKSHGSFFPRKNQVLNCPIPGAGTGTPPGTGNLAGISPVPQISQQTPLNSIGSAAVLRSHPYDDTDDADQDDSSDLDDVGEDIPADAKGRLRQLVCKHCGKTWYAWGGGHGPHPGMTLGVHDWAVADSYGDYEKVGLDCSGLVREGTYIMTGKDPGQIDSYTMLNNWQAVDPSRLKPGDAIFPAAAHGAHVQFYLGSGKVLEAAESGTMVRISALPPDFSARRFAEIPDSDDADIFQEA